MLDDSGVDMPALIAYVGIQLPKPSSTEAKKSMMRQMKNSTLKDIPFWFFYNYYYVFLSKSGKGYLQKLPTRIKWAIPSILKVFI